MQPGSKKKIVGRNGSGKSNFFWAVRFVLGDAYTTMTREERQALLHEGGGPATLSAYVEIIFDNSDNRFPTGKEVVELRRTIGLKKDEYSLDKKSVSKGDVVSLLEAAGFSRTNPYYIVPQGRITALCNSKDSERLALLKEVSGTRVYETRRLESLRIMEDTKVKQEKISEYLDFINERLESLESERQELLAFQVADRERRCLEYTIYTQELDQISAKLEDLDSIRQSELQTSNDAMQQAARMESEIHSLEALLTLNSQKRAALFAEKGDCESDLNDALKQKAALEEEFKETRESAEGQLLQKSQLEAELEQLQAGIAVKESQLNALDEELKPAALREAELQRNVDDCAAQRQVLYAKQGRASKFRNQAERNAHIEQQVKELSDQQGRQKSQLRLLESEITALRTRRAQVEGLIEASKAKVAVDGETSALEAKISAMRTEKQEVELQRKTLWREESKLTTSLESNREEFQKAERQLWGTTDRSTSFGLRHIEQLVREHKIEGVHGPLFDLFDVDQVYRAAVEAVAGNSLFHIVVDDEEVATRLLNLMQQSKTRQQGRVTLMPLNRLEVSVQHYPDSTDVIPMLKKLHFQPRYKPAMAQVFSKVIICKQLSLASSYARSHSFTAVTLEGDRADKRGALTGGFHDFRKSRLEQVKQYKLYKRRCEEQGRRLAEVRKELFSVDQAITQLYDQISALEQTLKTSLDAKQLVELELAGFCKEMAELEQNDSRKVKLCDKIKEDMKSMDVRIKALQEDLSTPFTNRLTGAEQQRLDQLSADIEKLKSHLLVASAKRTELETRRTVQEAELESNLLKRRSFIENEIASINRDLSFSGSSALEESGMKLKLDKCREMAGSLQEKKVSLARELEAMSALILEKQSQLDGLKSEQLKTQSGLGKHQDKLEKLLSKRHTLLKRREELNKSVRDLGVLPNNAYDLYLGQSQTGLVRKLHEVNEKLKKFSHVNKKAAEQYSSCIKQRDQLLQRKTDLDSSSKSIVDLIEHLDRKKEQAIQGTFDKVSKHFSRIFEQLVPPGRGELIVLGDRQHVDQMTGVAIKVSFNSKGDEGLLMQQLSGGQKSLVALALIFAIQMCDPAPFYLFDEVDANLDAAYRSAVALLIHQLSENAQFITTTFRSELCAYADRFYGATFVNKVSSIQRITKDNAIEFVESEMRV